MRRTAASREAAERETERRDIARERDERATVARAPPPTHTKSRRAPIDKTSRKCYSSFPFVRTKIEEGAVPAIRCDLRCRIFGTTALTTNSGSAKIW